jgi:hypothetical protein
MTSPQPGKTATAMAIPMIRSSARNIGAGGAAAIGVAAVAAIGVVAGGFIGAAAATGVVVDAGHAAECTRIG